MRKETHSQNVNEGHRESSSNGLKFNHNTNKQIEMLQVGLFIEDIFPP